MELRNRNPLLLVDLAVPRDIDPSVIGQSDVYLFNVDDLQAIADAHLRQRESEVARCEALIRQKAALLVDGTGRPASAVRGPLSAHA
jgi:glutamyl-tRNA reductase